MSVAPEASGPAGGHRDCRAVHPADWVRAGMLGFGLLQVATGLLVAIDPGVLLGPLDGTAVGYVQALATCELSLGVALLAAARLRGWRVPILAFAALHWTLLALTHLVALDSAPPWPEVAKVVVIATGAGLLARLLAGAIRAERWASP